MRRLKWITASLLAAPALMLAGPVAAQPEDHHGDMSAQEETAQPVDPNAIRGTIPEPQSARTEHRVTMEAGRRYAISVASDAFDPYLRVMRAGSEEVLGEDDDSGGGVSPRLVFTPPASGEYVVQVSSFAPGGHGDYALSVQQQAPLPALVTRPTRTERGQWQIYQGELAAGDPTDRDRRFDDYELRLEAGQNAMIHVQADADTMLQVFTLADRGLAPVAEDDDGGGGTNPFVFFAPEEAGTYVVRVIGFDETASGAYRLRISR